jgi:WD40 repeat protein
MRLEREGMKNNLTTTNQNAKLALSKSKSLLNITNSLLLKKDNSYLTKNFQFRAYFSDGQTDSVNSIVIHQNGRIMLSRSKDRTMKLWDIQDFKCYLRCVSKGNCDE